MLKKIIFALIVFSVFAFGKSFAQPSKIDSLENILKQHIADDTVKVNLLNSIATSYNINDAEKSRSYASRAFELSNKLNFLKGKSESLNTIGISYTNTDMTKAMAYFNDALSIAETIDSKQMIGTCMNSIGATYSRMGQTLKAIEYYQKAIAVAKSIGDKQMIGKYLTNISQAYVRIGNPNQAIDGYKEAIEIYMQQDNKPGMAMCYNNLGNIYESQGNYPLALDCIQKSLKIREEANDKKGISTCLISLGGIYNTQRNYEKSLEYNQKALQIAKEIKEKHNIAGCLINIGLTYLGKKDSLALKYFQEALTYSDSLKVIPLRINILLNIGNIYYNKADLDKALEYYFNALKISESIDFKSSTSEISCRIASVYLRKNQYTLALKYAQYSLPIASKTKLIKVQKELHRLLAQIYAATNSYKEAYLHSQRYKELSDSIYNESNIKQITELEYRYKYEKEIQIRDLEQQKKDAIQAAEKKQQNILLFSFIGAFILMSTLAFYIFHAYRIKRQSNITLAIQKNEIEEKNKHLIQLNEEISAQQEEISAQRDTVIVQKNRIEIQNKEITDSIDYAKHIQQSLLPSPDYAKSIMGDHFILYKPKDIVSGDFYWSSQIDEYLIVAIADCTGHGVPGAFMSVLGITLLNEIVRKRRVTKANEILTQLRISIIEALKQEWQTGEQKDGMDIALVIINTQTHQLQFSGAHIPLFIYTLQNGLTEIKPDKQTVAINLKMENFSNNEISLSKGDTIYLTTDGYYDQFGGINKTKFKKIQLTDMISRIANEPMPEQKRILDEAFENWKGNHKQTDDVTMFGLRI